MQIVPASVYSRTMSHDPKAVFLRDAGSWWHSLLRLTALAGSLCGALATAGPADFNIHSEEGDVVHVHYEPLQSPDNDDRCDIAFVATSSLTGPRLMVVNNSRVLQVDDKERGPKTMTLQGGHDYDSYDLGRDYHVAAGARGNAFGAQAVSPKQKGIQIAFYRAGTQEKQNRLTLRLTPPLIAINAPNPGAKLVLCPIYPGHKAVFLWTTTGRATKQPEAGVAGGPDPGAGDTGPARRPLTPEKTAPAGEPAPEAQPQPPRRRGADSSDDGPAPPESAR